MWLRTNQMTTAPGIIVSTPAAASNDQSMPGDRIGARHHRGEGQRVGRCQCRREQFSTQENMKQKNAVTPMPLAISGRNMRMKKRGKE